MNFQNISYFSVSSVFKTSRQMHYSKIQGVLDMCSCPPNQERIITEVSFFISFPNLFLKHSCDLV